MGLLRITIAALAGTSFMTAFSYLLAEIKNKDFKEPQLLNKLIARAGLEIISPPKNHITGWVLHYIVGFFFSAIYDMIWKKPTVTPNVYSGLIFGAFSGVFGITIWTVIFKIHPNPPRTHLKEFHIQLFIAHLIFGYFALKGYTLRHLYPSHHE